MAQLHKASGLEILEGVDPGVFHSARFQGRLPGTDLLYGLSFVRIEHDIRTNGVKLFDLGPQIVERPWIGIGPQGSKGELEGVFGEGVPEDDIVRFAQSARRFSGGVIEIDPLFGAVRNGKNDPSQNRDGNLFIKIGVTDGSPEVNEAMRDEFDQYNVIPEVAGRLTVSKAMAFTPRGIADFLESLSGCDMLVDVEAESLTVRDETISYLDTTS